VQVDAIVADASGDAVIDLTAADFEVLDDGRPVPIDRARFLGASAYEGDATLVPIRTHDDEEREASRDDVRVYAILLDDYHVARMGELRVIEPLLAFVRQLPATDLVAVYYPLDSVTDVHFARDREPARKGIRAFVGRLGDYTLTRPVEEDHLRRPDQIDRVRRQITTSARAAERNSGARAGRGGAGRPSRISSHRYAAGSCAGRRPAGGGGATPGPAWPAPDRSAGRGDGRRLRADAAAREPGPGDYVIELSARAGAEAASQYIAFRVLR